jgi:pilus assembly protein CpaB
MKRGPLLAAVGAAALGVILLMVYKKRFEHETSGGQRVPVLIAIEDVRFGDVLDRDKVALRELPAAYLEERHIRAADARQVMGIRVSRSIRANESILWSDLAVTSEDVRTLADMVKPGMRALSVPASLASTFGGLLRPGDRVDALLTTAEREAAERVTVPLLQNVLVLAVGANVGADIGMDESTDDQPGWRARATSVSVAVTIQQAELLTLAQDQGTLSLILRNPDDVGVVDGVPEATRDDLLVQSRRQRMQETRPRVRRYQKKAESAPARME